MNKRTGNDAVCGAGGRQILTPFLLSLCLTIMVARNAKGAAPDPCHSTLRCHRVADILRSRTASQIEKLYTQGCHDAPERIARALQMYTLHSPGSERMVLQAMPRSYKEYMAANCISSSELYDFPGVPGAREDSAKYNLPSTCVDESEEDLKQLSRLIDYWWKILVPIVARHPAYMPAAIALYEFSAMTTLPSMKRKGSRIWFVNYTA